MSDTFAKIYIHIVFAVKYRQALIENEWKDELYKYISTIIINKDQRVIKINGTADHIHILIWMRPSCCLSDLIREVKKSSTSFINGKKLTKSCFAWQGGYGAFSVAERNVDRVVKYIENQEEHHKKQLFKNEYMTFLDENKIDIGLKKLPEWLYKDEKNDTPDK